VPRDELRGLERLFDATLGWAPRFETPFGERPRARDFGRPWMAAFGDSHTFGDEVRDQETWPEALAAELGADVYNFGVGGYGPDQALLRFRQKREAARAPVVALGFGFENINRVVNRYRPFYSPSTGIRLTKPRFVRRGDALELLPNPVRSEAELVRLGDPGFLHEIGALDYWYARSGLPRRVFPYTRLLFDPALWRQAVEARRGRNDNLARPLANLWRDEEARGLFLAILDEFVREVEQAGGSPVLVVQPGRVVLEASRDGRGIPGQRAVREHCAARGYLCFDGVAALVQDADLGSLSAPGGHLSARGNQALGRALASWLAEKGLAPRGGD
jgi:hypothetical protein